MVNLKINLQNTIFAAPENGSLIYKYQPLQNLKINRPTDFKDLKDLSILASKAGLSIKSTIELDVEESYDGSANIIINDKKNPPKIVNSRFYLEDSKTYRIGDRRGTLDSNIYTENNFKVEANLIKVVQSVVNVDFLGLEEGGNMPIGNYTFYFKLADSDGNESDFIAESGKVVCHIGNINNPRFIRGGQLNENSNKAIKFKLNNLDLAYSYITIYYTRATGSEDTKTTLAYRVKDKFRISSKSTIINISGYEDFEALSVDDINIRYANFDSVKSLENCQNMTFAGNVTRNYELFKVLEKYSLYITPEIVVEDSIGQLNANYSEIYDPANGYEYYNAKNIYYKLSYWDNEIYRLGIVYIMEDYTLSPVFNIRGIKELTNDTDWGINDPFTTSVNYGEDFIIENTNGLQNSKGVFKIVNNKSIFTDKGISPIGLRFNFHSNVISGLGGLKDITKGFFIVRQKRLPTILAQAVGISTTINGNLPTIKYDNSYIIDTFLHKDQNNKPRLGNSICKLNDSKVIHNALLCPEADLRTAVFNTYFDSSEYTLELSKYQPGPNFKKENKFQYSLIDLQKSTAVAKITSGLLLINPEVTLIRNNNYTFSSKAGAAEVPHTFVDVEYGDYADPLNIINDLNIYNASATKVRGGFNTYIGADFGKLDPCKYYNIYQTGYDYSKKWKDYLRIRVNDSSPFMSICDRISWEDFEENKASHVCYRGDCYINTFTHRMSWNFIDPALPNNTKIVNPYNWYQHFFVANKYISKVNSDHTEQLSYNKLLPIFTYNDYEGSALFKALYQIPDLDYIPKFVIEPEDKGFKKYSELNGIFGYDKLDGPDINAVPIGHWITLKICSNINLAMRDIDLNRSDEEALFKYKRAFYPLKGMERQNKLPESSIINPGISQTLSNRYNYDIGDIPFIKETFSSRIYYSNILQESSFVNGNRVFLAKNYQDYSMEYGAIVKLIEWYGTLIVVTEHGILQIPVNERAMMKNESGENVYINTDNVLPKNPRVISSDYGSIWEDSIIKTPRYIYGVDTVAKKIWRTNGEQFELISDMKLQRFLNDNIHLKTTDNDNTVYNYAIKTHYNAFKSDVIFTYVYGDNKWALCYNELLNKWVTRYSWFPEFYENINNIFYTFGNARLHSKAKNNLYKHGFAGNIEESGKINPTFWYDEQHPFEFEFVVADSHGVQKIFNNLKIISNKVEPNSILYEITGEGFEWNNLKPKILELNKMYDIPKYNTNKITYKYNF